MGVLYRIRDILGNIILPYDIPVWNSDTSIKKETLYQLFIENYKRSQIPFQNVEALSADIPIEFVDSLRIDFDEPIFYGGYSVLKQYAGLDTFMLPPKNLGIQHGYSFEILEWEKAKSKRRNLVWSKELVRMYQNVCDNPNVYAIGSPFFYAKSLLDDKEIEKEKKRLGKNLLAFPMHSSPCTDTNFDPEKFLEVLKEERKRFDSVRVCLYWKDVLKGRHKFYQNAGFECVCNGHIYDLNFLRRQKSLFTIADATISNGVGSHIGYSIFMQKPHRLIKDFYEYKGGDGEELTEVMRKTNFQFVESAFLESDDYVISQKQIEAVDKFWGLSDFKTPKTLRKLLLELFM